MFFIKYFICVESTRNLLKYNENKVNAPTNQTHANAAYQASVFIPSNPSKMFLKIDK